GERKAGGAIGEHRAGGNVQLRQGEEEDGGQQTDGEGGNDAIHSRVPVGARTTRYGASSWPPPRSPASQPQPPHPAAARPAVRPPQPAGPVADRRCRRGG